MTTLQPEDCQTNDLNDLFPMSIESLRFPLHNSMRIIFTGYYNGFNVEVRSEEEMSLLHQMGCFGKGSTSRSRPMTAQRDTATNIMRKRQILKRNYWYKKFGGDNEISEIDSFLKDVDEVTAKIIADGEQISSKEVIDLVSSDENMSIGSDNDGEIECNPNTMQNYDKDDIVVIVPNSDSEEDNYFATMKPKCCVNKVKLKEKLMLIPEEAFFLLFGLGCLQIISLHNNILNIQECWDVFQAADKRFTVKYVVYHYFRSKGYVVKPGIKFGGDYLLYREGPEIMHADYVVVINPDDILNVVNTVNTLGLVRVANTTLKEILIAQVSIPKTPVKMPEGLKDYGVREILLSRNIPVTINEDE